MTSICSSTFKLVFAWTTMTLYVLPCFCFTTFLFGDSLIDSGNNNYLFTLSKADSPPYGIDFTPSAGKPTGRFTNGRTIADIVGEALGAKSHPLPYLGPDAVAGAFDIGVNYASGASGILDGTGSLFIERLPLREQINNFEKTREYMVNVIGENNTDDLLRDAIFSVTIGSNDVLNYFQPSSLFYRSESDVSPSLYQDFMVSNLTLQLKRLQALGARKLVVSNIGPLGCIPFIRATNLVPGNECFGPVNALVNGYNEKLRIEMDRMTSDTTIFVYANCYDVFEDMFLRYKKYGFEESDGPCCGGYVPPLFCYRDESTRSALCEQRDKYVFWDAYHPTEAANLIVADRLLNGGDHFCSPMNIRELYNHRFNY